MYKYDFGLPGKTRTLNHSIHKFGPALGAAIKFIKLPSIIQGRLWPQQLNCNFGSQKKATKLGYTRVAILLLLTEFGRGKPELNANGSTELN